MPLETQLVEIRFKFSYAAEVSTKTDLSSSLALTSRNAR